jgi:integrase
MGVFCRPSNAPISAPGLTGWRFHDLRHLVTALFRKGVAAPTVQALAGHAHLTTTERYAHVARTDLKAAIARLAG